MGAAPVEPTITPTVVPTRVGIHDFAVRKQESRGWRAFARHDG